jgi:hypothetical protein
MSQLQPVSSSNSQTANNNTINNMVRQINKEQDTKVFRGPNNSIAIINGKLPYEGGYGSLYYDSDGIPSIIIGVLPDGTVGIVAAKPGQNVLDTFV